MAGAQLRQEAGPSGAGSDRTEGGSNFRVAAPAVSLPKGGGAIRGIGEKFAANPVTGTGSMSVPIATSPGRSGFGPQLSLSYDSGAGNGPFGFGWSLSLPSITRKTDKGLPQYFDAIDSDVFILSGAEDLVPVLVRNANGLWVPEDVPQRTVDDKTYRIRRYRPRIEGLFARIERWTNADDAADVFWRSTTKDNVTTWYGRTSNSRIADPTRIFSWLICENHDDKGNVIVYVYKAEDSARIFEDVAGNAQVKAHERNRSEETRSVQRYLKCIRYGNRAPYLPILTAGAPWPEPAAANLGDDGSGDWMFEAVFDYGDHPGPVWPMPAESGDWRCRPDSFSSYRAGFELRSHRACQRVLMFHHFPGEAGVDRNCLVRSTNFTYSDGVAQTDARSPVYTFLKSVTQTGWRRHTAGGYVSRSLPSVEFSYSEPVVQDIVEEVDPASLENLPIGMDGSAYRWTDLHGEGIPGFLTEQAGAWYYKRNWSPVPQKQTDGSEAVKARFAPLETVALKPYVALGAGAEFMDLAGDGQPDVVVMEGSTPGLYEHDDAEGWQPFRPFTARLNRNFRDPNLKFVDLDGDGHADVLVTENEAFVWHASLAEEGFGPARRVAQALDEEKGPRIVFADGTQSIHLADLSGDGLTDIVRIRNGEVCYWPNLGHGRFGAKVTMDGSPWFDNPDQFDHKRIRLADIDGSGTTDIIYLHGDGVRLYFNQSGNGWSQPSTLKVFPRIDDLASIIPTDLLGNGTTCLVWSSLLPGDSRLPMRYVNLVGKDKPHLLVRTINNLGAETRVDYAPSTKFYLLDKQAGRPWITRLPFPVHVVERVETYDHISRNRFVARFAYHHGYFDGEEREFRGFGVVEQWDTEQFAALTTVGALPADNIAAESHVPPVHTKTWFHTGDRIKGGQVSRQLEREYFLEGLDVETARPLLLLDDTVLPDSLTTDEEREACRALKGSMLRQEVYADDALRPDGTADQIARARVPYTVTEQNFTIRALQPKGPNHHAVFFIHARETINYHYERNPTEPRIQHALTLEVDDYGNVLRQAAIAYGRREPDASLPTEEDRIKQALMHITCAENTVTDAVDHEVDHYRAPLPAESKIYEVRKPVQERTTGGRTPRHRFDDMLGLVQQAGDGTHDIAYEDIDFVRAQQAVAAHSAESDRYFRRLIERVRTRYRPDDCGLAQGDALALLPERRLEKLALPGESYKLALTPGLIDQVFQRPRAALGSEELLPLGARASVLRGSAGDQGGYVDLDNDGSWWVPSGRSFYHPVAVAAADELAEARGHFFLPRRYRDPFDQEAVVDFDLSHDLLIVETRDALRNRVKVEANDYRVLQPRLVSDPNGNRTEVAFDALGMVVGTAVMGKPTDNPKQGDRLDTSFLPDATQRVSAFIERPRETSLDPNESIAVATQAAHDLLANATTRIVYDLERFMRLREPPFAATIARETHVSDLPVGERSKLQISFSYSDGFGREIQKKIQAEAVQGSFGEAVLADRPLVHFRLDEAAGASTAIDASPQANQARVSASGVTLGAPGLLAKGTAALFDGQGRGRIVIPETPSLKPRRITIEAVVSWSGPNGYQQRIVEKSFSTASPTWPTYSLSVLDDGTVSFELVILNRPGIDAVRSSAKVMRDQSTHLVATYDGNTMAIYVNGVLDASLPLVGEIYTGGGPGDVGIGNQAERDRPFKGLIDEVALYDRALSGDRIRAHLEKIAAMRPRWVGSGWTIFNNKGKPVRQYEPFFSATHNFEFAAIHGVSPVLFYDPAQRVVATLHPNHTYEKVLFDPWQQTTWDVNDTCAPPVPRAGDPPPRETGDPRTDPDIGGYVAEYFKALPVDPAKPWQTWYGQRTGNVDPAERDAAQKARAHADTPTTAHLDALGRVFLTLAHNRYERNGAIVDERYATRVELDIEGNQQAVRDAVKKAFDALGNEVVDELGRVVMRYAYDMLGNRIRQVSMEAGARWMLNDVAGKPIRAWDSRGFMKRMTYDELRRPTGLLVTENGAERLAEKTVYGEGQGVASNHRTRVFQVFDSAGRVTSGAYDFKSNLLRSTRDLLPHPYYKNAVDWNLNPAPNDGSYSISTAYDALNRPTTVTAPDGSVYRPAYNEANLLDQVDVSLRGELESSGQPRWTPFVANIDYNAKGQRTLIRYQNGAETRYRYDEQTFLLVNLKTTRPSGSNGQISSIFANATIVQDLRYTYDPTGNISGIEDAALATVIHAGQTVEPVCRYTYDAIYRLIEATGREHIDQSAFQFEPPNCNYRDHPFVGPAVANNAQAVHNYTERYEYDAVGNFERMLHRTANGGWTRGYAYEETSLIEDGVRAPLRKTSNRLSSTTLHPNGAATLPEPYTHDAHGNITRMPHLPLMQWDFKDKLRATSKQETIQCTPETTFYIYDAAGQRVRKVTERQNGTRKDERIYLDGLEIYREYNSTGTAVTLERETLHVLDDKQRIALVETKTVENGTRITTPESLRRYQLGNHLGSACLELDGQAQLISYEEYAPYASSTYQVVRSQTEGGKRYRYVGKERDEESGFYHHGARYCAPWIGRWTSCDPGELTDGVNRYVAMRDSPATLVDPDGAATSAPALTQGVGSVPIPGAPLGSPRPPGPLGPNRPWLPFDRWQKPPVAEPPIAEPPVPRPPVSPTPPVTPLTATPVGSGLAPVAGVGLLVGLAAWFVFAGWMISSTESKYAQLAKDLRSGKVKRIQDDYRLPGQQPVDNQATEVTEPLPLDKPDITPAPDETREPVALPPDPSGVKAGIDPTPDPSVTLEVAGRKRGHNATFMKEMLKTILADPNHPLRMLVDPQAKDWLSRAKYSQDPTVQAGHLTSLHSGAPERLAIEDSTFNQWSSNKGESQGAVFEKSAVSIGGIPVELRTARLLGVLPPPDSRVLHPGWKSK